MYRFNNYFKAFILLVLLTLPNFAKNNYVFKRDFNPNKNGAWNSKYTISFISHKNLFSQIAQVESKGKYNVANEYNMIGKYQVSKTTLKEFGYSETYIDSIYQSIYSKEISNNKIRYFFNSSLFPPSEQERFIRWYTNRMEKVLLKHSIKKYVGTTISGVNITKAGILHASMLGHTHVKNFLESNGRINYTPRRGFSVKQRLRKFENVEVTKM